MRKRCGKMQERKYRNMKMNKKKGIISLILMAVVIIFLGFTTAVGFGKTGSWVWTWPAVSALPIR